MTTAVRVPFRLTAHGGFDGPIGLERPDQGLFSRVGVGTDVPQFRLHVVATTSDTVAAFFGSNASGALLRVRSTSAAPAGLEMRANSDSILGKVYKVNTTGELRIANSDSSGNYVDVIEILGSSSRAVKILRNFYVPAPGASNTPTGQTNLALCGNSGAPNNAHGADGQIYFRSDGGTGTTIYQRRAGSWVGIV